MRAVGITSSTGQRIVGRIYFATNEVVLDEEDMREVEKFTIEAKSELISAYGHLRKALSLEFLGWTDHRGSGAYNLGLSQSRADHVRNAMEYFFLYSSYWKGRYRVSASGLGEGQLRGGDLSGDRRVDIFTDYQPEYTIRGPEVLIKARPSRKFSRQFQIRTVFELSPPVRVPGIGPQLLCVEMRQPSSGESVVLTIGSLASAGFSAGLPASRPTDFTTFSVPANLTLEDFVGAGSVQNASWGFGSRSFLHFYGPADRGRLGKEASVLRRPITVRGDGWDLNVGIGTMHGYWNPWVKSLSLGLPLPTISVGGYSSYPWEAGNGRLERSPGIHA